MYKLFVPSAFMERKRKFRRKEHSAESFSDENRNGQEAVWRMEVKVLKLLRGSGTKRCDTALSRGMSIALIIQLKTLLDWLPLVGFSYITIKSVLFEMRRTDIPHRGRMCEIVGCLRLTVLKCLHCS
ncbi:hypothetical protein CEXT_670401 [Caerostris extrusa]|uniref:Uncharacterized protein n=1 Tax=Caerostris extrusa TaxID=172846 RepID=A0AAV4WK29_CAEEX|nr:hypothetical protein CEXT_670401 [Caerostris extrusa]